MERDPRIAWKSGRGDPRRFLEFFAERGHTVVPSSSLVPAGDHTLLFVNSGMVPFKDALTGAEKRSYTRAVNFQRCLRVAGKHNDFEEVGRSPRHHTFFEMLGNWSFGDYFKREAIHWAWDFLTKDLGIPGERLAATVYTTDDFAHDVWKDEIGLPPERLVRWGDFPAGDEKNWWRMADIGPCGPCSEIHFDRGPQFSEGPTASPTTPRTARAGSRSGTSCSWSSSHHPDRSLTPLPAPSVDTGMGLERVASVVQQVPSNYDTDLFAAIHARMRELFGHDPDAFEAERFSYQVIADHSRAMTFLLADGVLPSNEGRGYVVPADHPARGPARPAARAEGAVPRRGGEGRHRHDGRLLPAPPRERGVDPRRITREEVAVRPHARGRHDLLEEALIPLTSADREVGRKAEDLPADAPVLSGDVAFKLHDTYGFPIDLTVELAAEYGVARRPGGVRRGARRAARAQPLRHEGRHSPGDDGRALPVRSAGRAGDTEFVGYETTSTEARDRRDPPRWHRVPGARGRRARRSCASRPGAPPSSCSTGRRSTPRAAARSGTAASSGASVGRRRRVRGRGHAARGGHAGRRADRPPRHARAAGSRSATPCRPRSTPSGAPTRCATTPARTCSIGRCGTSSASGPSRPARSCTPTTCASTSRSTGR